MTKFAKPRSEKQRGTGNSMSRGKNSSLVSQSLKKKEACIPSDIFGQKLKNLCVSWQIGRLKSDRQKLRKRRQSSTNDGMQR